LDAGFDLPTVKRSPRIADERQKRFRRPKFPIFGGVSPLFGQVKWLVLRGSYFVSVEDE
jgi:hypothetical protein